MGKLKEKSVIMFVISLVLKLLFAASFLLMPMASDISLNKDKNGLLYFAGALFWVSLILSIVTSIIVTKKQKEYYHKKGCQDSSKRVLPAIFTFFSCKEAKIVDILMLVFVAVLILLIVFTDGYLLYVFLFLSVLFIELHSTFNGKNYRYIKELKSGGTV